jgi:hypothetical protein
MALIQADHPAINQSSRQFWQDELDNARILLADTNQRIHLLEVESYSLNTSQNATSVKRSDLNALSTHRDRLLKQIAELEALLGVGIEYGPVAAQVVPL